MLNQSHADLETPYDSIRQEIALAQVGLINDGKRVKRKGGTGDKLIDATSIEVLGAIAK
jgi:hypothetical protein